MVRGRNPAAISGGNVAWSGTGHADGHGRNRHHLGDAGAGGGGQEEQDRVAVEDVLFSGLLVSRDDDENMTAAAAQGGEGVRIRGGGDGSDRRSLQAHALPVSRANGGPPSPSTPSSWLLGPDADLRDPRAAVDGAPHAQHEQQAEQLIWLRLLDVRRALMLFGYRGAEGWRARAAEDGWERENRQARRAPAQEGQQEQDDDAFTAACEEAREDGKLTREGGGGDAAGEEQVEEERQCRICFGGEFDDDSRRDRGEEEDDGEEEEEEDLGRLISPCLCSGSMRVSLLPGGAFCDGRTLPEKRGGGIEGNECNAAACFLLLWVPPLFSILLSVLVCRALPGVTGGTEHSQRNGWLTRDSPLLLSLLSDLARLVYRSLN